MKHQDHKTIIPEQMTEEAFIALWNAINPPSNGETQPLKQPEPVIYLGADSEPESTAC